MLYNSHEKDVLDVIRELRQNRKQKRPGREIKLSPLQVENDNIRVKIGTVEDKNCPKTVFINISFWLGIKNKSAKLCHLQDGELTKRLKREIKNIYKKDLFDLLHENKMFPNYFENIYTFDFPENINYNKGKKCFISIDLSLFTDNQNIYIASSKLDNNSGTILNMTNNKTIKPLKKENGNEMYEELIKISKLMANTKLLRGKSIFSVQKEK